MEATNVTGYRAPRGERAVQQPDTRRRHRMIANHVGEDRSLVEETWRTWGKSRRDHRGTGRYPYGATCPPARRPGLDFHTFGAGPEEATRPHRSRADFPSKTRHIVEQDPGWTGRYRDDVVRADHDQVLAGLSPSPRGTARDERAHFPLAGRNADPHETAPALDRTSGGGREDRSGTETVPVPGSAPVLVVRRLPGGNPDSPAKADHLNVEPKARQRRNPGHRGFPRNRGSVITRSRSSRHRSGPSRTIVREEGGLAVTDEVAHVVDGPRLILASMGAPMRQ